MSAAPKPLLALAPLILLAAACDEPQEAQDPVINEAPNANVGADIEALPPDESVATSSEELANGANDPDVGELGNEY